MKLLVFLVVYASGGGARATKANDFWFDYTITALLNQDCN
jgi:hypothetical protein